MKHGESYSSSASGGMKPGGFLKDQNGDGKITADDLPEKARGRFSMMDANGDGELDASEKRWSKRK